MLNPFIYSSPEIVVFGDDFDDNSIDAAKWARIGAVAGFTVLETNQRIEINSGATSGADGLVTVNSYSMLTGLGRSARQEVVLLTTAAAHAVYLIAIDASNRYFGFVRNGVSGNLSFEHNAGTPSVTAIPYDATAHRWMRLNYDSGANNMLWQTSPDNSVWTTQRTVGSWTSLTFTNSSLKFRFQLNATSSGGVAQIDNFAIKDN